MNEVSRDAELYARADLWKALAKGVDALVEKVLEKWDAEPEPQPTNRAMRREKIRRGRKTFEREVPAQDQP